MDAKPYKVIEDLYKLFLESEGQLTDKQVGYITATFKTLLDLYWEEDNQPLPEKKKFQLMDIIKGE